MGVWVGTVVGVGVGARATGDTLTCPLAPGGAPDELDAPEGPAVDDLAVDDPEPAQLITESDANSTNRTNPRCDMAPAYPDGATDADCGQPVDADRR